MQPLVDMKQSKKDKKKEMGVSPIADDYPYGLQIQLNDEQIKKIKGCYGLNAGDKVQIVAEGSVTSREIRDHEKDGKKHDMSIQIKKFSVAKKTAKSIQDALSGKSRGYSKAD